VKFEQFFTPELARLLETRGDEMLAPREAEVTVLFCDIRGFSRITSRCPAAIAIEWVRETLSLVSDCVAEHRGTLIDYGGDSLEALWGAPQDNPDHALDACQAALAMQAAIPELSRRWEPRLGEPTAISIGIHTGPAQVGNIGSRRKFKYGAFGTTVNLASRIQGTTKHAGVYLIISGATALRVIPQLSLRRLCQVRTVNISQPVDLYELVSAGDELFLRLRTEYEGALALFEQAQFPAAQVALEQLLVSFPHDPPAAKLLARVQQYLSNPPDRFDGIWDLDSK
jgi:adenylate cyclase